MYVEDFLFLSYTLDKDKWTVRTHKANNGLVGLGFNDDDFLGYMDAFTISHLFVSLYSKIFYTANVTEGSQRHGFVKKCCFCACGM